MRETKETTLNIPGRHFLRNTFNIHKKLEGGSHTKPSFLYSTGGVEHCGIALPSGDTLARAARDNSADAPWHGPRYTLAS